MPNILYYSSYCDNCQKLLSSLSKNKYENTMFFSVDSRETVNNQTYLILSNGSRVVLPVNVTQVPSLLIIDENTKKNTLTVGKDIYKYFNIEVDGSTSKKKEVDDVVAFELGGNQVPSDTFSYLETSSDDLLATGNGGLQQLHNYSTLDVIHNIETPPDNYTPNTISHDDRNLDDLKKERELELQ